jgi:hypothetical protein
MNEILLKQLKTHGIQVMGDNPTVAQLGFGDTRIPMIFEAPIQLRRGNFDIEEIGAYTYLGGGASVFRHIGKIGRFCSIAGNITAGSMEHPTDFLSTHPMFYGRWDSTWPETQPFYVAHGNNLRAATASYKDRVLSRKVKIEIGNDVLIGEGVFIARGVTIGSGAVVAARSVVTMDVPPYAIVGGTPAKLIRFRFDDLTIERLLRLRWWDYGLSAVVGVEHNDIFQALDSIERRITEGIATLYQGKRVRVHPDDSIEVCTAHPPLDTEATTSASGEI